MKNLSFLAGYYFTNNTSAGLKPHIFIKLFMRILNIYIFNTHNHSHLALFTHNMLDTKQLQTKEIITQLSIKTLNLSNHRFISKHQSGYLKTTKDELKPGAVMNSMGFAENYSFVLQDAVHGFHCDNSQASLHPFVVY